MSNSRELAASWPYPRHDKFVEDVRSHAKKWFALWGCKVDSKHPYCLADWSDWGSNIILPDVVDYIQQILEKRKADNNGFPLHRSVHHGLSSQALLFNLIVPLILRNDLDLLNSVIDSMRMTVPDSSRIASLEYEDRKIFGEDRGQPTSIDLVIGDPSAAGALFLEAKFVESGFGGCSVFAQGDCDGLNPVHDLSLCYLHHIGRRYWALLGDFGFLDGPVSDGRICVLALHYQFFREVLISLAKGGNFVLLSDKRSPTFYCTGPAGDRGLMPFLTELVPAKYRHRICHANIQDVVHVIEASGRHAWINKFKMKYGIS